LKRLLGFALIAGAAVLLLPTCRSTRHTVARIATPVPVPTEVFIPAEPAPTSTPVIPGAAPVVPPGAPAPAVTAVRRTAPPMPSPTPTTTPMPVVTARPEAEPSPGVLYEQYVPTVVAVTPAATEVTPEVTPIATRAVTARSTRPPRTPTPAPTQRPGAYYEDEEGRPLTPTPSY
jgi:hypothetical protein